MSSDMTVTNREKTVSIWGYVIDTCIPSLAGFIYKVASWETDSVHPRHPWKKQWLQCRNRFHLLFATGRQLQSTRCFQNRIKRVFFFKKSTSACSECKVSFPQLPAKALKVEMAPSSHKLYASSFLRKQNVCLSGLVFFFTRTRKAVTLYIYIKRFCRRSNNRNNNNKQTTQKMTDSIQRVSSRNYGNAIGWQTASSWRRGQNKKWRGKERERSGGKK